MKTPLTPQEADRVFDLVAEAGALEPEQRAAFLAQACAGAEGLRAEVESLLDFRTKAPQFLASPAFGLGVELLGFSASEDLKPGDTLGDYRVLSLLGSGGMGEVYLADDAVHGRQVALKLIGQGRAEEVRGRHFRHERKVLATLNHPHIARLYGSGVTDKGQAYLVMEYVEGERLDRYCQDHGLDIAERLALFRKVCAAVSYAHQNLVVHRDLKPANIRVTPQGEPKLLDFGIAKLLDPEGTLPRLDPTATMQGAMTPEYASPEQIKGEPITTASDVYSLGVVLFELLTDQRPFARLKSRRPDELARAICEEEPPRPSTVATYTAPATTTGSVGQVPATREPSGKLRRRLQGDLDNIVAKALRKEPARRYPSVLALSEDIRRHCEGLPVTARNDTLGYRASKFVRRNIVGVTAAAAVVLTLIGGLIVTIWQAHVADQERDHARAAQSQAETAQRQSELARKQAERLNGFLQTLLGSANPSNGPGRDVKVVQVLDQAGAQLDRELAGEPALLAQAHQTVGQAYAGLQQTEPALRHLRAALALNRQVYGEDGLATARSKAAVGTILLSQLRVADEAVKLLDEAITVEKREPSANQAELLEHLLVYCRLLYLERRFEEASAKLAEAVAFARQAFGEESETYANCLGEAGMLRVNQGDYAGAEEPLRQALALCRRLPRSVPFYTTILNDLSYDLLLQGKSDEPETLLRESMDLIRRAVGEETLPYYFDTALLGLMHYERGEYPAAEREMRSALEFLVPRYQAEDEDLVGVRVVLALSLMRQGRPAEGEPFLRKALEISRTGPMTGLMTSPAFVRSSLIDCLVTRKDYVGAEPLMLEQYDETSQKFGAHDPHTGAAAQKLHDLYIAWNKPAEAARFEPGATAQTLPTP